jgi:hypothetical protein
MAQGARTGRAVDDEAAVFGHHVDVRRCARVVIEPGVADELRARPGGETGLHARPTKRIAGPKAGQHVGEAPAGPLPEPRHARVVEVKRRIRSTGSRMKAKVEARSQNSAPTNSRMR